MPIRSSRTSRMGMTSRTGLGSRSGLRASSSILSQKDDVTGDIHFKWDSIKKFLYIAFAYASDTENFDIFSKVSNEVSSWYFRHPEKLRIDPIAFVQSIVNALACSYLFVRYSGVTFVRSCLERYFIFPLRIFDFIILEVSVGMTYMCMDFFIRQYTQSLDLCGNLNPLLRGINLGSFLQSALWTTVHAYHVTDIMQYLLSSLSSSPSYSICVKTDDLCVSAKDVMMRCRVPERHNVTLITSTSSHFYYNSIFKNDDRSVVTNRCFFLAIMWLVNFFISSVSDDIILKILKLSFIWRCVSMSVSAITIAALDSRHQNEALAQILNITAPHTFFRSMDFVTTTYSIGFIGLYDLGSMSPYTMVDNTVVIFTTVFTLYAFAKALVFKILFLALSECVTLKKSMSRHYLLFAVAPLSAEFVKLQKLFNIHFFVSLLFVTITFVSMSTICMATILNTEFQSVKQIYLVGMLCFFGFFFSLPFAMWPAYTFAGARTGIRTVSLFLGVVKVGTVMYIYGLNNFTTDIRFWLGYKPTKFWTVNWFMTPIILMIFLINKVKYLYENAHTIKNITAFVWITFVLLTVLILNVKTVIKFIMRNNVMGLLKPNRKYGPPDPEIRKRRRNYSETESLKTCTHGCMVLDENFDCSHAPETEMISKLYVSSEVQLFEEVDKSKLGKKPLPNDLQE